MPPVMVNPSRFGAAASGYSAAVLADSPLAYYRLGEASGTTMLDSSGNARNGTYRNSPTLGVTGALTSDSSNTAVTFDGTNDDARVTPNTWAPKPSADWSVELWMKYTATGFAGVLAIRADDGVDAGTTALIDIGRTAGRIGAESWSLATTATRTLATSAHNDGNWHHVVATYVASSRLLSLYVDAVFQSSATQGTTFNATNRAVDLAANNNAGAGFQFFGGSLDEVAIYGSALSSARIAAHYAAA